METESQSIEDYLVSLPELSMNSPMIKQLISSLFTYEDNEIDIINKAYLFVRDEISHSWDIQAHEVTQTAEEVLKKKHGICYAKSNLLASLLRSKNIPTGFLYQRLLLTNNKKGPYCIHALNSVYISSINRWIKLDARGNKENVNAQFSLEKESLAFYPDEALDEKNYDIIFTHPNLQTMNVLKESNDALHMYMNDLPSFLTFS